MLTRIDADAFWRLRLEALESEPRAFGESAEEHRLSSVQVLATRLSATKSGNFILGAFLGEQLVGNVGFSRNSRDKHRHKGHVWGVYVAEGQRGRGIGQRLLSELIRRAASQRGLEQITLTVGEHQSAAKRLYAALGFEVFAHEKRALKIGNVYVDEDHMVLYVAGDASKTT